MNTTIFVLMVFAHGWIPSIEFKDSAKCEAAASSLYKQIDDRVSVFSPLRPWCAKIEK